MGYDQHLTNILKKRKRKKTLKHVQVTQVCIIVYVKKILFSVFVLIQLQAIKLCHMCKTSRIVSSEMYYSNRFCSKSFVEVCDRPFLSSCPGLKAPASQIQIVGSN